MTGLKIIVVDDESYIVNVVASRFRSGGAVVFTSHAGFEALEIARREVPDLIVTDYQMPDLNGLELATRLREHPTTAHIPMIMLTAAGHALPEGALARTNVRLTVDKPFSATKLLASAQKIVSERVALSHPRAED
jgi:CheY-like chemotaxis protein